MRVQPVRFEIGDDAVGEVLLDRPEKRNAMDEAVFEGLHGAAAAAAAAAADGRCRAVLLTGAGAAFSAGLDVGLLATHAGGPPPEDAWIARLQQAFSAFEDLPVPVVAAVRGVAIGAGCQLALAAHLRVGAPDAELGLLETRWGLLPDLGATYRLPRLIGLSRAADVALSGRHVDARTALSWGLLDALLPGEDFARAARDYAAALAAGPTVALGRIPALLRQNLLRDRDAALAAERAAQRACLASGDFVEAVHAAAERRNPVFRGR